MQSVHFFPIAQFEDNEFCLMAYAIAYVCVHTRLFTRVFSVLHAIIYTRSF